MNNCRIRDSHLLTATEIDIHQVQESVLSLSPEAQGFASASDRPVTKGAPICIRARMDLGCLVFGWSTLSRQDKEKSTVRRPRSVWKETLDCLVNFPFLRIDFMLAVS